MSECIRRIRFPESRSSAERAHPASELLRASHGALEQGSHLWPAVALLVEEVDLIVYLAAEALRLTGILLQPFMPNKARLLLDQLGVRH